MKPKQPTSLVHLIEHMQNSGHTFADNLFLKMPYGFPTHCKEFSHPRHYTKAINFSNDGTLLATGTYGGVVRIWDINQLFDSKSKPKKLQYYSHSSRLRRSVDIMCTTISSDKKSIFSGTFCEEVLIHDLESKKLMKVFSANGGPINDISLSPESDDGKVFASASHHGCVRIYDIRQNSDDPVITIHTGSVIFSAMFSPADSTHIAVGGETGARGIDVRYPKGSVVEYDTSDCIGTVQYNSKGTRLMIYNQKSIVIHEHPAKTSHAGKVTTLTQQPLDDTSLCTSGCFVGTDGELVASTSQDGNLYIWAVPAPVDGQQQEKTVYKPLLVLPGNGPEFPTHRVRYNQQYCMLASFDRPDSGGNGNTISILTSLRLPGSLGYESEEEESDISISSDESMFLETSSDSDW